MVRFALRTLSASKDPEKLICSRTVPLGRSNLKMYAKNDSRVLSDVVRDVQAFSSSFVRTMSEDEEIEVVPQATETTTAVSPSGFAKLSIDFKAAQLYFNILRSTKSSDDCANLIS